MHAKYINPLTDYGFKRLFGQEANKDMLKDFLNSLLPATNQIADLSFKNNENTASTIDDRNALFDIYCQSTTGERFIVELQKSKQNWFKDRTVYYSTFPIQEQALKGDWTYKLEPVFCIGILDFTFDDYAPNESKEDVIHTVKLKNQHGNVFYDKLTFIYLELPNFKKKEHELTSRSEQWMYWLKHLEDFQVIPDVFKDTIFTKAFEAAAIANFKRDELETYEGSLKQYRDIKGFVDTAFEEGKAEGLVEGETKGKIEEKLAIAKSLKINGISIEIIAQSTGLSVQEIEKL